MMSPARRHVLRATALASAVAAPETKRSGAAATEYELLRAQLGNDLRRLHDIQSIEGKIALKRELLPAYVDWVRGVLQADAGGQDDILTHVMIWLIDAGAFDEALPLAAYVIRHNLILPERFDRTAPTLIAEEIAEAALKRLGQAPDAEDDDDKVWTYAMRTTLERVAELVADRDIFDQVRAKLEKARGLAASRLADALEPDADGPAGGPQALRATALAHLRRALQLDAAVGVKKRIEQLERALRPAAGESASA